MISAQVIKTCLEELRAITKVDLGVFDPEGGEVAATFDTGEIDRDMLRGFVESPADGQMVGTDHLLKIREDEGLMFVLVARGSGEDTYVIGKIAVSQISQLMAAYKERFDKNNFFQNLILDNMLLVDIYNRAKKLHIDASCRRVVLLVETDNEEDNTLSDYLGGLFSPQSGDYITAVDETNVILIKALKKNEGYEEVEQTANMIVDMMNTEAMLNVRVSIGTIVEELKDVSKSYKEAAMAMDVGRIFYIERRVNFYRNLGIGRLIYQLPANLCEIFVKEIFGENDPADLDEEILTTVNKFYENNLNVSETSRQLFVHRNTLVYRLEKLQKSTGLDVRTFDDALTFKIAMMVVNYMHYLRSMND